MWGMILVAPYFFMDTERLFQWDKFIRSTPYMVSVLLVFYVNHFFLIKKYLFQGQTKKFILYNFLLIAAAILISYYGDEWMKAYFYDQSQRPRFRRGNFRRSPWFFIVRNFTALLTMAGLSVALKMTLHWFQVENERKELEKAKSVAELQNLKNQISPHFLLNTLNNIYALIEFNPPKAREAVLDLSKMLRYILYDNDRPFVPLKQEVNFISNYFQLMRIRISSNVELKTKLEIQENSTTQIAPLIYISLVENAFKHGISGNKPSFINISLVEKDNGVIEFYSQNSFFPKTVSDKSGSGIGTELLRKRLDLIYSGRYVWTTELSEEVYSTKLIIHTKQN